VTAQAGGRAGGRRRPSPPCPWTRLRRRRAGRAQAAFEGVGSMPMARIRGFRTAQQAAVEVELARRGRGRSAPPPEPHPPGAQPAAANGGHTAGGGSGGRGGNGGSPAPGAAAGGVLLQARRRQSMQAVCLLAVSQAVELTPGAPRRSAGPRDAVEAARGTPSEERRGGIGRCLLTFRDSAFARFLLSLQTCARPENNGIQHSGCQHSAARL